MTDCECGQANIIVGFHYALMRSADSLEMEVARIISIVRHLPCADLRLGKVEVALVRALAGARQHHNGWASQRNVYVCGGMGHQHRLLLAVTHDGVSCSQGTGGPVTCEANSWQADVADYLLHKHLIDRVEFGLSGRQLVLSWLTPRQSRAHVCSTPPRQRWQITSTAA